jgi:hypothetical protein
MVKDKAASAVASHGLSRRARKAPQQGVLVKDAGAAPPPNFSKAHKGRLTGKACKGLARTCHFWHIENE